MHQLSIFTAENSALPSYWTQTFEQYCEHISNNLGLKYYIIFWSTGHSSRVFPARDGAMWN